MQGPSDCTVYWDQGSRDPGPNEVLHSMLDPVSRPGVFHPGRKTAWKEKKVVQGVMHPGLGPLVKCPKLAGGLKTPFRGVFNRSM